MSPLVLIHGFMGGAAQWRDLEARVGEDTETIALDLPGFGANAHLAPLNQIEHYAAWAVERLRDMGCEHYRLLGHSMGGMIAQEMARRAPEAIDRLVLYGTGPVGDIPGRFESMAESRNRAETDGADATATRIAATWFLDREASPGFATAAKIARQARLPALLAGLFAMEQWSGRSTLSALTCPTLIIWGEHDRSYNWTQVSELWTSIPGASLCVLPNCAHLAHLEEPQIFEAVLTRYLSLS